LSSAKTFAQIAELRDDEAAETLLFLRKKGYSILTLCETSGLSQQRIEELLMLGIRMLHKMRWTAPEVARVYRFDVGVVLRVLRGAGK
jgi:hypothetical protein